MPVAPSGRAARGDSPTHQQGDFGSAGAPQSWRLCAGRTGAGGYFTIRTVGKTFQVGKLQGGGMGVPGRDRVVSKTK